MQVKAMEYFEDCTDSIENADNAKSCCMYLQSQFEEYWSCNCGNLSSRMQDIDSVAGAPTSIDAAAQAAEQLKVKQFVVERIKSCQVNAQQIKNKIAGLFAHCLKQRRGYEDYWPTSSDCDCENFREVGHGNTALSSNDLRDLEEGINYCRKTAEGGKYRTEEANRTVKLSDSPVSNVGDLAEVCDGQSDPYNCCSAKKTFFKSFWPDPGYECSCMRITSSLGRARFAGKNAEGSDVIKLLRNKAQEEVINCIRTAEQNATKECIGRCEHYVNSSTIGCPNSNKPDCSRICVLDDEGILENFLELSGKDLEIYKAIESNITDQRQDCVSESKKKFISAYKKRCMGIINKLQEEKKQTLLCGPNATKENTRCEEYCRDKAENKYGEEPRGDQIATEIYHTDNEPQ